MFPSSYVCPLQKAASRRSWLTQTCANPYCGAVIKQNREKYGLSHYLSGQVELDDACCRTNVNNFDIIFAGPVPPNPSELLGGDAFRNMLEVLRMKYDYVIVDTPPLGSVIDAAIVGAICDGTVIVVESGASATNLSRM